MTRIINLRNIFLSSILSLKIRRLVICLGVEEPLVFIREEADEALGQALGPFGTMEVISGIGRRDRQVDHVDAKSTNSEHALTVLVLAPKTTWRAVLGQF